MGLMCPDWISSSSASVSWIPMLCVSKWRSHTCSGGRIHSTDSAQPTWRCGTQTWRRGPRAPLSCGGVYLKYATTLWLVHHDLEKLLLVDFAVLIEIKLVDHSLSGGQSSVRTVPRRPGSRPAPWPRASNCAKRFCPYGLRQIAQMRAESLRGDRVRRCAPSLSVRQRVRTQSVKGWPVQQPVPLGSFSRKISSTSAFFKSKPSARIATFSSW